MTLQKGQQFTLSVDFTPVSNRDYKDSIFVRVNKPCRLTLKAECTGAGYSVESTVRFPVLEGKIADRNFKIPLKARIDSPNQEIKNFTFAANVSFDAEMFVPQGLTTGNIVTNTIENGERLLEIEGTGSLLNSDEIVLTEIIGDIVLSGKVETSLKINEFNFSPETLVNKIDGKLITTGVCINEFRGIRKFTPDYLDASPNPAASKLEVNVSVFESGDYTVKMFDRQGRELKEFSWEQKDSGEKLIIWNLEDIPSGIYNLVLQTEWDIFHKTVSVVK